MKLLQLASTFALLSVGVNAGPWSGVPGMPESSIIKHDGTPVGKELKYEGRKYAPVPLAEASILYSADARRRRECHGN